VESGRRRRTTPGWRSVLLGWDIDPDLGWRWNVLGVLLAPPSSAQIARDRMRRFAALFPHIEFDRLRPLDVVRFSLQLAWLALLRVSIPDRSLEPRGARLRRLLNAWLRAAPASWVSARGARTWATVTRWLGAAAARFERASDSIAAHDLWRLRAVRCSAYAGAALLALLCVTTPFAPREQAMLGGILVLLALTIRSVAGQSVTFLLIVLSLIASTRYIWWRSAFTLNWDDQLDLVLGILLLLAECYAWLVLVLGYFQTASPLRRDPVPLPDDASRWPTVDIYIPTYNEPISVVAPTVLAALAMDWPRDRVQVYVLDDGRRDELRRFATDCGARYIARPDNRHAKAGNLNHALTHTRGEFVAVFDCDHVATRSFLTSVMGCFLRDARLALVQTPHHFFSPDPFERNLGLFRRIPNEGELFHGLIQDGNDLWNATFFCGSCGVLKRSALEEIGGFAVHTVTEDAHTALKLQRRGYTTALVNVALAAGLATDSLSAHIRQRIRWARGMAQIFRLENPFLGGGLTWPQRVCYASSMLHFFNGGPRLIFLTAPLAFLLADIHVIHAAATEVVLYFLPQFLHASITNSRLQGGHRRSFWSEVYETVLAWYIAWPTAVALLDPSRGRFKVTLKGGISPRGYFDWRIAAPFLVLAVANLVGFAAGIGRVAWGPADEVGTTLINMAWSSYNLILLGAAIAVASEPPQRRLVHRAPLAVEAVVHATEGQTIASKTKDVSQGGVAIDLGARCDLAPGDRVVVSLGSGRDGVDLPAQVVAAVTPRQLGLRWEPLSREQMAALVSCTFSRPDAWSCWSRGRTPDRPLAAFREVSATGIDGYRRLANHASAIASARMQPMKRAAEPLWQLAASLAPRTPPVLRPP
jgi:cellulose synthase (UDP-forming)